MKRIIAFLISCAVIIAIAVGVTNCSALDKARHQIKYVVDGEEYYAQSIFSADEISLPEDPQRKEYDFAGWFYDEDTWKEPLDPSSHGLFLTKDIVVYAKWVPHTHLVLNGKLTQTESGFYFTAECRPGCDLKYNYTNIEVKTTITKPATCLAEGEISYSYTYADEEYTTTEITPKLEHQLNGKDISAWLDETPTLPLSTEGLTEVGKIVCGKTGTATYKCTLCNTTQNVTAVRDIHEYGTWTLTRDTQGKYIAKSTCTISGCGDPNANFELTEADGLVVEEKPLNCESEGYVKASFNGTKNGYKIVANYLTTTPRATNHIINGVDINELINETQDPNTDDNILCVNYYDENGESHFVNVDQACGTTFEAWFNCSHCNETILVYVYKAHKYETVNTATCTLPGQEIQTCTVCNHVVTTDVDALGHSYNRTLQVVGIFDNVNYANNSFNLIEKCTRCGGEVKTPGIPYNDTDFKITVRTSTNCKTPDKYDIVYSKDGIKASVTAEITNHMNHKLNGSIVENLLVDVNGNLVFKSDIPGLTIFDENPVCYEKSHVLYEGMYVCEACGVPIYLDNIYVVHDLDANGKCTDCGQQPVAMLSNEEDN